MNENLPKRFMSQKKGDKFKVVCLLADGTTVDFMMDENNILYDSISECEGVVIFLNKQNWEGKDLLWNV